MTSILVIQLKRLGDLILTTPALSALRAMYPEARITLLIDDYARDLAPALAMVDEVRVFRRNDPVWVWRTFAQRAPNISLDFTGNDRSALATFISKAAKRVGFSLLARHQLRSWVYTDLVQSSVRERHTIDHYLDLIRSLGPTGDAHRLSLAIPPSISRSADSLRRELAIPDRYFVVHPGAARPEKYWLPERWVEIIRDATKTLGMPAVLTGGRQTLEREHVRKIREGLGSTTPFFDLTGRLDFLLSAAVIKDARFFLGVDTAGAHVAAVFERPQVVLFGPTNPYHWSARHRQAKSVRAGFGHDYSPEQPREHGHPMSELSTETVSYAMENLFGEMDDRQ
jgi:ADP-heptose:LPS heptosyltransferase